MNTLPENLYTKQTLSKRIGSNDSEVFFRNLSLFKCTDVNGQNVIVTRYETTDLRNNVHVYKVEVV